MKIKVKVVDTTYEVEIEDLTTRPVKAVIDGETFDVWPAEPGPEAPALERKAPSYPSVKPVLTIGKNSASVKAPIPGVITALSVNVGDEVKPGQELCKLEAMKMNNSIRANKNAKISSVLVSIGQQVKYSDILFEYYD